MPYLYIRLNDFFLKQNHLEIRNKKNKMILIKIPNFFLIKNTNN